MALEIPTKTVPQIKNFYQNYKTRYGLDKMVKRLAASNGKSKSPPRGRARGGSKRSSSAASAAASSAAARAAASQDGARGSTE